MPYSLLPKDSLDAWLAGGKRIRFEPGQRIIRPDELNQSLFLILSGEIRFIAVWK